MQQAPGGLPVEGGKLGVCASVGEQALRGCFNLKHRTSVTELTISRRDAPGGLPVASSKPGGHVPPSHHLKPNPKGYLGRMRRAGCRWRAASRGPRAAQPGLSYFINPKP